MALLVLGVLVAVSVALFVIPGATPKIDARRHPNSVAILEQVPVNDTRQWVAHSLKRGGEYYGSSIGAFGVVLKNLVFSRGYTMVDRVNFFRGIFQSVKALYRELSRTDLFVEVPAVEIPVYFCLGRHDFEVPSPLSARYFEALKAPRKQLVWFERSAHMPNTEEKDKFNEFMINTVLPLVA